jgi:hypothetical protein
MTNTEFLVREHGSHHITPETAHAAEPTAFGLRDVVLVLGFIAAFLGLIFLLSR